MKKKTKVLLTSILVSVILLEVLARMFLPATPFHPEEGLNNPYGPVLFGSGRERPEGPVPLEGNPWAEETQENPLDYYRSRYFKSWGKIDTNRTKVLIVGDSHTGKKPPEDGKMWWRHLEEAFPRKEFFVAGGGDAGTLQEYILLNRTIDRIKPDVVILQFCAHNDYYDNSYRRKKMRWPFTTNKLEPYLIDGEIQYRLPSPLTALRRASKTVDFLMTKLQYLVVSLPRDSDIRQKIKGFMMERAGKSGLGQKSYRKTEKIMEKVIDLTENTSFYILKISGPVNKSFRNKYGICRHVEAECIKGVDGYVIEQAGGIKKVDRGNDHWNGLGNRLAAEYLEDYFKRHNVLSKTRDNSP